MFGYVFEFFLVLVVLVLLFFLFRALIRSPRFTAWVNGTVSVSASDAEAELDAARDRAVREMSTADILADEQKKKAARLKKRVGRNQFE